MMLLWLFALHTAITAPPADATVIHKVALSIGANYGNASEQQLKYAVDDAQNMASVLVELGGFASEDVTVLSNPTPDGVRDEFAKLRDSLSHDPRRTLLFVYYSGHADALAVHLGSLMIAWDEMLHLTNKVGATTRVLLVDACRSGQVTRMKGSRMVSPFSIASAGPELPQGFAILASASADEAAQESDDVGGSIFTRHFITALRGVGDINHDGRVSLTEAYEYSSDRTIASSANSMAGVQHATFRYHLSGHADLSLTEPGYTIAVTPLVLGAPGQYYLRVNDAAGALAGSITVDDGRHAIWLPPGHYFVQRRTADTLYEGELELHAGATGHTDRAHLKPTRMAAVATKGASEEAPLALTTHAATRKAREDWQSDQIGAWGGTGAPVLGNFSIPWRLAVQYAHGMTPTWALDAGAELGQSSVTNTQLTTRMTDIGVAAGARARVTAGAFEFSGGGRIGGLFVQQSYAGSPQVASTRGFTAFGEAVLRLQWQLARHVFVGAEMALRGIPAPVGDDLLWRAQPVGALGWGGRYDVASGRADTVCNCDGVLRLRQADRRHLRRPNRACRALARQLCHARPWAVERHHCAIGGMRQQPGV